VLPLLPVGRTLLLLPVTVVAVPPAERLPALGRTVEPLLLLPLFITVEPLLLPLGRTVLELLPEVTTFGATVVAALLEEERLPAVFTFGVVVVVLFTTELPLVVGRVLTLWLIVERLLTLFVLLDTVAALLVFGEAVATLRLPAAAALLVDAGRRPCAIAPVDVMASPLKSIKPITVL
jgi:hypothetical protein